MKVLFYTFLVLLLIAMFIWLLAEGTGVRTAVKNTDTTSIFGLL